MKAPLRIVGLAVNGYSDSSGKPDDELGYLIGRIVTFQSQQLCVVADLSVYPGHIKPIYAGTELAKRHDLGPQ